jgi:hypothetical protein
MNSTLAKVFLLLLTLLLGIESSSIHDLIAFHPEFQGEVDRVLLKDFLKQSHASVNKNDIIGEFRVFKKEWTENMVEFLIKELEIN